MNEDTSGADLVIRARAPRGDIAAANPLFRRIEASAGWNRVLFDFDE